MRKPKVKRDIEISDFTAKGLLEGTRTTITFPVDTAMFYNDYSQGNGVWVSQTENGTFIKDLSVSDMWIRLDHYNYMWGPYRKGEVVYCRESFALNRHGKPVYKVGYQGGIDYHWITSFRMGERTARFWLKITNVAIRRLQDMTVEDSLADGVRPHPQAINPLTTYKNIWNKEHEIKWEENPWVWVLTVERVNGKEI